MQAASLTHILAIVKKPPDRRSQEEVHALVVLLTEQGTANLSHHYLWPGRL